MKKSGRFITSDIQPKYEHQAVNRKGAETQKLAPPKEEKNKNFEPKLPVFIDNTIRKSII